uniref:Uncharacterized protein n=1 Tax=Anguilla anguilla TaxID=7936 RepID=A0A0E9XNK8_ANGAN
MSKYQISSSQKRPQDHSVSIPDFRIISDHTHCTIHKQHCYLNYFL